MSLLKYYPCIVNYLFESGVGRGVERRQEDGWRRGCFPAPLGGEFCLIRFPNAANLHNVSAFSIAYPVYFGHDWRIMLPIPFLRRRSIGTSCR